MPRINILSPFVADLIAAGEVVERPASAVKELIENSLDAGARNITVEIRGGGAEYLRVTDDGCGMSAEDAGIAFLRHATSKLRDERGLEAIGTLGFRGEALAAISSVSHVELLTRERGAQSGTRVALDAGEIAEMGEAGCPEGTTMIVRGLFYNTPARLKFMKSDRAEGAACVQAALRCALGRPDVSVRCIKDGKEEFFTPGDGRAESAVYTLLGRDLAASLAAVSSGGEGGIGVTGFASAPGTGRGSRGAQYFFCNGRYIRSQLLQAAVEQAYKNSMLTGRFPACVIYLDISAAAVDVNVHPAKTEVKFSDERRVFDAAHYAVLGAIEAPAAAPPPAVEASEPKLYSATRPERSTFRVEDTSAPYQTRLDLSSRGAPRIGTPAGGGGSPFRAAQDRREAAGGQPGSFHPPASWAPQRRAAAAWPEELKNGEGRTRAPETVSVTLESALKAPESPSPAADAAADEPVRLIGEALGLYIIAQRGGELIIIDKHAAHERIIFDRISKNGAGVMSQTLMEPVPLTPPRELAEVIGANLELLSGLGFEIESYGEGAFILRSAPCELDEKEAAASVEEIAEGLERSGRVTARSEREEALKTVACKAAIKAGRSSEPEELLRLAEAVCRGEITTCPHGRPVAWTLTRRDLDRQFKRIV